jgi:hypothetical protein
MSPQLTDPKKEQAKEQATRELTAKLRAERLTREAMTRDPKGTRKPKD